MGMNINKYYINNFLCSVIIFILLFSRAFQEYFSDYSSIIPSDIIEYITQLFLVIFFLLFFLLICCLSRYKIKISLDIMIIFIISLSSIFNQNILIFFFIFILWSIVKSVINTQQYISIMLVIYSIIISSIIILYSFGTGHIIYEIRFGMIETYGLNHQNLFPVFIFLFSIFFILFFYRFKWLCFIYLMTIFSITILFFTARSLQVGLILILLFYIISFFRINKWICFLPLFLLVFSLLITFNLNNYDFLQIINLLSSSRFYYSYLMLDELNGFLGLLFGSSKATPELPLDNSYIAMIYKFGLVPTLFFLYMLTKTIYKQSIDGNNLIVCMILVICIFSLFENIFPRTIFNFVIYFMVQPLFVNVNDNK